jgi:hypothetical protein
VLSRAKNLIDNKINAKNLNAEILGVKIIETNDRRYTAIDDQLNQ